MAGKRHTMRVNARANQIARSAEKKAASDRAVIRSLTKNLSQIMADAYGRVFTFKFDEELPAVFIIMDDKNPSPIDPANLWEAV